MYLQVTTHDHYITVSIIHCPNGKIIGQSILIVQVGHGLDNKKTMNRKRNERKPCTAEQDDSATPRKKRKKKVKWKKERKRLTSILRKGFFFGFFFELLSNLVQLCRPFLLFFSLSEPCPTWTMRIDCLMIVPFGQCIILAVSTPALNLI